MQQNAGFTKDIVTWCILFVEHSKLAYTRWGQTTPQMGHEMSRFLVNF